jgi:kynurenine formamidase
LRIVDLSAPITPSTPDAPELMRTSITYHAHADGAREIEAMFGVPPRLLRDGEGWTREVPTIGTHNSTHIDAPYHYSSVVAGTRAQTIDELPLAWFFRPSVVVDFRHKADGDAVTVGELEGALAAAEHTLRERDIVLVRTGRDSFYGLADYMFRGPGVTAEATHWLYDRGVRVMGIDAWGWDRPLNIERPMRSRTTPPVSSGRHTRRTYPTARSSGCTGSTRCRRPASAWPAFRSGSWPQAPRRRGS